MEATTNQSSCRAVQFLESSIGRKMTVALAGLLLCGFLISHLFGNLFLYAGGPAFNRYANFLESNPLLPFAEGGLVVLFLVHIVMSLRARAANAAARPIGYQVAADKGARTPGSRTMTATGLLVLAFVVIHVATIKYRVGGDKGADLFAHVTGWFKNPLYSAFYVLAVGGVGFHLSHGVQSAFQTFGVNHPRYTPFIKLAGLAFAGLMFLGFASMPVYFYFVGGAQ